ncbi:hypothetical protein TNCV_4796391 [Trichonephila clavipes]|uniref:Uncharacterized protein n=1 Tax=Trichonephila clavipes TaxID=2585209 RepID=A0A8X6S2V3_TRICX|nr:hypothetical protein TNCV_4796391 [Trichonephila clavipes]
MLQGKKLDSMYGDEPVAWQPCTRRFLLATDMVNVQSRAIA